MKNANTGQYASEQNFSFNNILLYQAEAGVAQSVQCLITDWTIGVQSLAGTKDFPLISVSRPALRPTQPPIQWIPGVLSPGQSAAGP
jgi:hypothetical protein